MTTKIFKGFSADRRVESLDWRGNPTHYSLALSKRDTEGIFDLDQNYFGGRRICLRVDDVRWLRDVLSQLTFCDHVSGEPSISGDYNICPKCGEYRDMNQKVETKLELPSKV